jgi:hypothetical protein
LATVIGIAWYEPGDWTKLRAIAPDIETLENTHEEWLAVAEKSLRELRLAGYKPQRVPVTVAALQAWCDLLGRRPDASARSEYASVELQRLHDAGLLDPDA